MKWTKLPRSMRFEHPNGQVADVWNVGGEGWRFTIMNQQGIYTASDSHFGTSDEACFSAECLMAR